MWIICRKLLIFNVITTSTNNPRFSSEKVVSCGNFKTTSYTVSLGQ